MTSVAPLGLTPDSPPNIRWKHGCGGDAEAIVRTAKMWSATSCFASSGELEELRLR
jgi:hypothetical protein